MAQPAPSSDFHTSPHNPSVPTAAPASALQPLDLERELSCSICTDILYQPLTLLDCLHTFCGSCLKEWFGWQAKATEGQQRHQTTSVIYTCPSCRAPVRETRPNATVTTLLELYLRANPGKAKSEVDRKEIADKYKIGEAVLQLPTPLPSARPSRRTQADVDDEEDQRLMQEVRELSLRDVQQGRHRRSSRDRESRNRHRRHEGRSRSRRNEESSPHEAARRELESQLRARGGLRPGESLRSLEHQGSLRTLMSRSGAGSDVSNAVQGDIMREILEGNLLDELDFSHVDEGDQEAVSELIARAYLEKHQRRGTRPSLETGQSESRLIPSQATDPTRAAPPVSRPHLLEVNRSDRAERSRHRRSSSQASSRSATQQDNRQSSNENVATTLRPNPRRDEESRERSTARRRIRRRGSAEAQSSDERQTRTHDGHAYNGSNRDGCEGIPSSTLSMPNLTCEYCSRRELGPKLHHICSRCPSDKANPSYTICHRCYKSGKGCQHWYGFGGEAHKTYMRKAPPGGYAPDHEPPHSMQAGRYSTTSSNGSNGTAHEYETGLFCHECQANSNSCYWHCDDCNTGEFGFCNMCVNQARHCTHPLQALYMKDDPEPSSTHSRTAEPGNSRRLLPVPIHTSCDHCSNPIPPSSTRYHCPTCNNGDYDICSSCYGSLVNSGRVTALNGPRGWRKCPSGHRMLIVGFEGSPGSQRRIVVGNVVGGWRTKEEDTSTTADRIPEAGFTWRDAATGSWKHKRALSQSADPRGPGMPFMSASNEATSDNEHLPPATGTSMSMIALWARIPDEGPGHEDELEFPKAALITEVFTINETWAWGVCCKRGGLFPEAYGRVVR